MPEPDEFLDADPETMDVKYVGLREAKKLISQRLRDPKTDSKSFTHLLIIYSKFHALKRRRGDGPSDPLTGQTIDDMVRKLEHEKRNKKRDGNFVMPTVGAMYGKV